MSAEEAGKTFGEFVRQRRESLGKTVRGMSEELGMTPAYLSDIEKGNRYAPEKHLDKLAELLNLQGEALNEFYDLAGKNRNHNYPDLSDYIGKTDIARVALRKARDLNIPDSQWQSFIDKMSDTGKN